MNEQMLERLLAVADWEHLDIMEQENMIRIAKLYRRHSDYRYRAERAEQKLREDLDLLVPAGGLR